MWFATLIVCALPLTWAQLAEYYKFHDSSSWNQQNNQRTNSNFTKEIYGRIRLKNECAGQTDISSSDAVYVRVIGEVKIVIGAIRKFAVFNNHMHIGKRSSRTDQQV